MNQVYIGYDPREDLAFNVAIKSLMRRSRNAHFRPIYLKDPKIASILTRPIERNGNTMWCPISQAPMSVEFAISRFCVPFLQHEGWALFTDCDVLFLEDVNELFKLADDKYAVMVVKHEHNPKEAFKMDGQIQTSYPRKNWSSVVLWNCSHPANTELTIDKLNTWPGRDLHAFKWLPDEFIGELPSEWNHLVGVSERVESPKIAHYTLGGPWIRGIQDNFWDKLWLKEFLGE